MSAFKPSAVSFRTPDMPPPDVGSSIRSNITAHRYIRAFSTIHADPQAFLLYTVRRFVPPHLIREEVAAE